MSGQPAAPSQIERLRFLASTVVAEAGLLESTDARLFTQPMTPARAAALRTELDDSGLLDNADEWIEARQPRNLMVHEYIRDSALLAASLQRGHERVPLLTRAARRMDAAISARLDPKA